MSNPVLPTLAKPFRFPPTPHEYKVVPLRECPTPESLMLCDTPEKAADYWRLHIAQHPHFNPECECLVVLILNTRRRVKGHYFVASGTLDSVLMHPREVFRVGIMSAASALVVMHNHPSGEAAPSEADIRATRELIGAGRLLKMELLDHIIIGCQCHSSLRALGYFHI
jgi:DNA repair protein RadC